MKMAFIYSAHFFGGKKYDFSSIWNNPEGLTGSELSYLRTAIGMVRKGHEVHLYTLFHGNYDTWQDIHVHDIGELGTDGIKFDTSISWNDTEPLKFVDPNTLRITSLQINDFGHCSPNVEDYVDLWISPSESHRKMVTETDTYPGIGGKPYDQKNIPKWKILHHGCDLENYDNIEKVRGRVIWASSPDRGLHWLLQEWPKIRNAVPEAHLKIFYRLQPWIDGLNMTINNMGPLQVATEKLTECQSRAVYISEVLKKLDGVEALDSVSRNQIDKEMAEAEVLAFPCDTVSWSEGFSITLMEACGARACPISIATDALPEVYGEVVPMVGVPAKDHMSEFSDLVIRALTDPEYRKRVNGEVRGFAENHTWDKIVDSLETIIKDALVG